MNVIFAISPNYLEALYNESKNFEFTLQGYGNIAESYKGLQGVNIKNILGFIYLGDKLPDEKQFKRFLRVCNLISANNPRPFVIALCDGATLGNSLNTKKYKNLKFYTLPSIEILTNLVIKADIFGPILLDNFQPYQFNEEVSESKIGHLNTIEYKPIISDVFYKIFSPAHYQGSLHNFIENDKIYNNLLTSNKLLAECRLIVLRCKYLEKSGTIEPTHKKGLYDSIKSVERAIQNIEDNKIYCCMVTVVDKLGKMVDNLKVS